MSPTQVAGVWYTAAVPPQGSRPLDAPRIAVDRVRCPDQEIVLSLYGAPRRPHGAIHGSTRWGCLPARFVTEPCWVTIISQPPGRVRLSRRRTLATKVGTRLR